MTGKDKTQQRTYRIRYQGNLDAHWSDWFGDAAHCDAAHSNAAQAYAVHETGQAKGDSPVSEFTLMHADQAKLRGVLTKLWDLNLVLLSVEVVENHKEDDPHD